VALEAYGGNGGYCGPHGCFTGGVGIAATGGKGGQGTNDGFELMNIYTGNVTTDAQDART